MYGARGLDQKLQRKKRMKIFLSLLLSLTFVMSYAQRQLEKDNEGFPRETIVHTTAGHVPLQKCSKSSKVFSFDFKQFRKDKVLGTYAEDYPVFVLAVRILDFETRQEIDLIKCGYDQLFFVANRRTWVKAQHLRNDDVLVSRVHGLVRCNGSDSLAESRHLHSLEVENEHNFFVGKSGILIHNYIPMPAFSLRLAYWFGATLAAGTFSWNVGLGVTGVAGCAAMGYYLWGRTDEKAQGGLYGHFDVDGFGKRFKKDQKEYHQEDLQPAAATGGSPEDQDDPYRKGRYSNSNQMKILSEGEIKKLKAAGYDIHDLKPNARFDLFKDPQGNIFIKPKDGSGPGDPLNININEA